MRTRTVSSTHWWELYCPKKTRTCLTLAHNSNRPSEQLPLLFCCFFVRAAWRAEPALWEHQFGSPACPAQSFSKKQMVHLVTGAQGLPALSEKLCHLYLCVCLSVCLTTRHRAAGFMDYFYTGFFIQDFPSS